MITFHILGLLLGAILIANILGDMLDSGEAQADRVREEGPPWKAPPPPRYWQMVCLLGLAGWAYYLLFV